VEKLSQQGPATPDHVIRTKPYPMLGRDVAAYARKYREYFEKWAPKAAEKKTMLDVAPRMVLDAEIGFVAAGRSAKDAAIVEELYDHTIDVILRAEALGGWRALHQRHTFDIEYWDLEQAKLRKAGLEREIWQSFAVLPDIRSVGVMGDERTYAYPIVVRAVTSEDAMTADWARLPYDVMEAMSSRIINEVAGVNRVAYDITSKPPGTIEWE